VNGRQILSHEWLRNAIVQIKGSSQFHYRKTLQHFEDYLGVHIPARNQPVAMIAILQGEIVGCYRIPEGDVVERCEPFFNVLNVLKNNHGNIIPNHPVATQICGPNRQLKRGRA